MNRNLVKTVLESGGSIVPLLIDPKDSKGLGLMNPSILVEQTKILLNLRNINYTLYHCEGSQLLNGRWGPLSYLHPENDMHLRTWNFMCELNLDNLEIQKYWLTDTTTFDKEPLWDFVGLEDARLVRWENKLFQCGVRRDTTPNGVGRMELSEIEENEAGYKEISRSRIEPPINKDSYCEKNWMPVLDLPYHFVKWTNPTEVVKVNPATGTSQQVFVGNSHIPGVRDFRGGSQVITWKNFRLCLLHEVNLFSNKLSQKDARYMHRFLVWDKDWNVAKLSEPFSFMDGEIEFGCGLALYKKDLLCTFGFQDNAAYLLRIPEKLIEELLGFKKDESDKKKLNSNESFEWGEMNNNNELKNSIIDEIFTRDSYQKYFKVEEGDVVLDVGASVGPFSYSILNKKPKKIFAIEPNEKFFPSLLKNTSASNSIICINKAINCKNEPIIFDEMWGANVPAEGITFKTLLENYNINKIDFIKTDCEGGEYDIFNDENLAWIKQNVKKIAGEFHLNTDILKEKFKHFRDTYLKEFSNYHVESLDGVDITWDLWNDHFIEFYFDVIIYIDNTPIKKHKIQLAVKNFGKVLYPEKEINSELSYNEVIAKNKPKKWEACKWPTLEITTSIPKNGCINDCVFCPQRVLTNKYAGDKTLSLDNFKKAIETVPKEITIIFSGFTEPFLNKETTDMILYAHEKGHKLAIFTTGIGMSVEDFDRIKHIPFSLGPEDPKLSYKGMPMNNGGFTLHIPDQENYAKHPITNKYIKLLEHIRDSWSEIQGIRVVSMGAVHEKVKHVFSDALPIDIWARANNLIKEIDLKPELKELEGKDLWKSAYRGEGSTTCGLDENVYHNVLLPSGDVVICCQDYDQEHILGNLLTQNYEDIIPEYNATFNLCRFCENGVNL